MTAPKIDFHEFLNASDDSSRRRAAQTIVDAARTGGFFYLTNSGISATEIERMIAASRTLFALPRDVKLARRWDGEMPVMGYVPREYEGLDESRPPDLKEAFNVPPPPTDAEEENSAFGQLGLAKVWPEPADPVRDVAESFAARCFDLGQKVFEALAIGLELPEPDFFSRGHRPRDQTLRLLHYFPAKENAVPRQRGAGDHSDHGTLTLLFQDQAGGLEFLDADGEWKPLPPIEDTVLVNAGDLLTRWTGGVVRSAPHRVLATPRHRISLAYFFIPRSEVLLKCPETSRLAATPETPRPFNAQEFLMLRSIRRMERLFRHHRPEGTKEGEDPASLIKMRRLVCEKLGMSADELQLRLSEFGQVDFRELERARA